MFHRKTHVCTSVYPVRIALVDNTYLIHLKCINWLGTLNKTVRLTYFISCKWLFAESPWQFFLRFSGCPEQCSHSPSSSEELSPKTNCFLYMQQPEKANNLKVKDLSKPFYILISFCSYVRYQQYFPSKQLSWLFSFWANEVWVQGAWAANKKVWIE